MQLVRKLLLAAIFVGVLVFGWRFAADHAAIVVIHAPLWGDIDVPLWTALVCAFGLGVVVTGCFASLRLARQGLVSRRYRKVIHGLESEVHQLRSLPLTGEEAPAPVEASGSEAPVPERVLGRGA